MIVTADKDYDQYMQLDLDNADCTYTYIHLVIGFIWRLNKVMNWNFTDLKYCYVFNGD